MFLFLFLIFFSCGEIYPQENEREEGNEILPQPLDVLLTRLTELFQDLDIAKETTNSSSVCKQCEQIAGSFINIRKSGANRKTMKEYLIRLCVSILGYLPAVCNVFSEIEMDVILYIIDNKDNLTPARICGIYLQHLGCTDPDEKKWIIDLPPKTDKISKIKKLLHQNSFKIVQITDVHYDPLYKAGSNAKCDMPLCCEERNGPPIDPKDGAGAFGDYRVCDMSRNSILNLLGEIKKTQKNFDYVYFTGDIIAHKNWETSRKSNLDTIREFYNFLHIYFGNITVFPVLGNHEAHPCNLYAPLNVKSEISTQWLFDAVATLWSTWLPSSALETIRKGGYYSVRVHPGFRIIVLNSNVCFTENFWLFYEDKDPYDQLKWLVQILSEAEKTNEKVHILSHIPPGEARCIRQWQYNFNRIVQRFADVIRAHFNGHTHYDEFRIYKNESDSKQVVNVAFNGGSFTTFVGLNPDYRIYEVDSQHFMVLDYQQYTFNLSMANSRKDIGPEWYKLYSFKSTYGLDNLEYDSFLSLTEKLESIPKLAEKYVWYHVRESEHSFEHGCNKTCIRSKVCHISAVDVDSSIKCGDYS